MALEASLSISNTFSFFCVVSEQIKRPSACIRCFFGLFLHDSNEFSRALGKNVVVFGRREHIADKDRPVRIWLACYQRVERLLVGVDMMKSSARFEVFIAFLDDQ